MTKASKLFRYGGAVTAVAVATLVRMLFDPVLLDSRPLVTYLAAIMFTAWLFGSGPTLVSVVLSLAAATYFFVPPRHTLWISSDADQVGLLIFLVFGVVTALFSEQLRRARERDQWRLRQQESTRALLDSERRFRQLADAMPQMVWTIGPDGYADYFNERWYEYTGLPRGLRGEESWAPAFHPDDVEPTMAAWKKAVETGYPFQVEYRMKDCRTGSYRWHLGRAVPGRSEAGQVVQWFGTATDIDDHKRAEEALQQAHAELERRVEERTRQLTEANINLSREIEERRAAEARLREQAEEIETLMEVLPVPIWIARDPDCHRVTGNLATYELTRLPLGTNVSKSAVAEERQATYLVMKDGQEVPPEELPMRRAAATGKEVRNAEFDFVFVDGSVRSIYGFAAPLFAEGGQGEPPRVRGCVGAFIDITEKKRLENNLRESEQRFQAFMDHMPAGAWVLDDQSRCVYVNRFYSSMTGLDIGCIVGKTAYDLYPPEIAVQHQTNDRLVLEAGSSVEVEEPYIRPDGTPGELLVVKFPMPSDSEGRAARGEGQVGNESAPMGAPPSTTANTHPHAPAPHHSPPLHIGGVAIDVTERKRAEDRMRRLAVQLANAEDTERRRLATDLHDSIGQSLSLLKLRLEPSATQYPFLVPHLALLDNIIGQARTLMFELYPSMLHDLGLVPTLRYYSEQLSAEAQVAVNELGKPRTLPVPVSSSLFRAVKELLGNALRHGRAHEIFVSVHWRSEALKVVIDDDGCGFEPARVLAPSTQRGLGLAGIHERLASFSGKMLIESEPQRGTRVILEVPVP